MPRNTPTPRQAIPSSITGSADPVGTGVDAGLLIRIPVSFAIAKLVPQQYWAGIANAMAEHRMGKPEFAAREAATARRYLADWLDEPAIRAATVASVAAFRVRTLTVLRELGSTKPRVNGRLLGREHLDQGLSAGRGAILWVAPFMHATIGAKAALHMAGFSLTHLSRPSHGFGGGWFALHLLNGLAQSAEDKFLAERVMIKAESSGTSAIRALLRRLAENRLVSITVGARASATLVVPQLASHVRLAIGPAELARRARAPVLPVFTLADPDGTLVTTVEGPLVGSSTSALLHDFADRLSRWMLVAPGQVMWHADIFATNREPGCTQ